MYVSMPPAKIQLWERLHGNEAKGSPLLRGRRSIGACLRFSWGALSFGRWQAGACLAE